MSNFKPILVIDDDEDLLNILELDLNKAGFEIVKARNLKEARNELNSKTFLCAVIDIVLGPKETSEPIFSELNNGDYQLNLGIPCILMSAHMNPKFAEKMSGKLTIAETLIKPVARGAITEIIEENFIYKILVVDDDPSLLELIKLDFKNDEFQIYTSTTNESAINLLKSKRFFAVILDIIMGPNKTSDEVLQYIQSEDNKLNKEIPIIITSAHLTENFTDLLLNKCPEIHDTVKKPFKRGMFSEKIKSLFQFVSTPEILDDNEDITREFAIGLEEEDESGELGEDFISSNKVFTGHASRIDLAKEKDEFVVIKGVTEKHDQGIFRIKGTKDLFEDDINVDQIKSEKSDTSMWNLTAESSLGIEKDGETFGKIIEENINVRNKFGMTPIMVYSLMGQDDLVYALLSMGADTTVRSKNGKSAIHYAAKSGNIDILQALIDANAKINSRDEENREPLFDAIWSDRPEAVKFLIESGARTTSRVKGQNYLMWAVTKGSYEVTQVLLEAKIDPALRDPSGKTAIKMAKENRRMDLVKLIQEY